MPDLTEMAMLEARVALSALWATSPDCAGKVEIPPERFLIQTSENLTSLEKIISGQG